MTGIDALADKYGFLVAYPQGTGRLPTWNAGACCGYAQSNTVDDVAFIAALIDRLSGSYKIDRKRVYTTGISNGAMMSYRLACELSDTIAAAAPVEGAQDLPCHPSAPVSIIVFHGTADQLVPFHGGNMPYQIGPHRVDSSVPSTIEYWVKEDSRSAVSDHSETAGGAHVDIYPGCARGSGVALCAIQGGRHDWPGSPFSVNMGSTVESTQPRSCGPSFPRIPSPDPRSQIFRSAARIGTR